MKEDVQITESSEVTVVTEGKSLRSGVCLEAVCVILS
jgi:hypothetical protein